MSLCDNVLSFKIHVLSKFWIGRWFGMAIALMENVVARTVAVERDEDHVRNCFIGSADPDGIG